MAKLLSFLLFLLSIGLHTKGSAQDIDTLIDVGGYKLHFKVVEGRGTPILFESGAGNDGSVWKDLLKPLDDSLGAPLITYDREGFGKSGIDTAGLSVINEVKGLEAGLRKLGYGKGCFVVAHSLGGAYAMVFSSRNEDRVQGGVFIDNVSPCFMTAEKAHEVRMFFSDSLESIKRQSLGFYFIARNYEYTSRVMREAAPAWDAPLTVICSDDTPFEGADSIRWKRCMQEFARVRPNRKYIFAKGCSHYVFDDNPGLVIKAIVDQYRAVDHVL
ncbi:alpha/beta hydrolase [Compostibacter hankyongensis]|uniref:AB hydrolase-1 domain-containing protein n=1 Tax=Compostibacter hankyongensis TaxID=1007089 RepID=A0ABP8G4W4_9BACT